MSIEAGRRQRCPVGARLVDWQLAELNGSISQIALGIHFPIPVPMPTQMPIELKLPALELVGSYLDFINEMRELGEQIWEPTVPAISESHRDFVARILRADTSPVPPLVPETTYWGVLGSKVVGRIALRHHLNANLSEFGGHIGYEVRPSVRCQGIAKEMLRLLLATPKAVEIGRLLLTCEPNNISSNKTIAANGGVLERTLWVERIRRDTRLYWITLKRTESE